MVQTRPDAEVNSTDFIQQQMWDREVEGNRRRGREREKKDVE